MKACLAIPRTFLCSGLVCAPVLAHAQAAPEGNPGKPQCTVHEIARVPLVTTEGRQLYVEPLVLEPNSRGEVLFAGTYNYLFDRAPSGKWERALAEDDSILGAILPRSGHPRVVPSPVPSRLLGTVRAAARADGAWDVVFAEVKPWTGTTRRDTVARLWHGVLDGTRWASLEQLPLPAEGMLQLGNAPSLVRYGDTLAWALIRTPPRAGNDVVVFERRGAQWSHEIVRTYDAAYAQIAHSDTLGLVLGVVASGNTLFYSGRSLHLWRRQPTWERFRKLVPERGQQLHQFWLGFSPAGTVLSWRTQALERGLEGGRGEVRAMLGPVEERDEPAVVLDSAFAFFSPLRPVAAIGGTPVWVLDHLLPDQSHEIRVVGVSAGAPVTIARVPSRFISFAAASLDRGELLVVGGLTHPSLVSLAIRFQMDCPSGTTSTL